MNDMETQNRLIWTQAVGREVGWGMETATQTQIYYVEQAANWNLLRDSGNANEGSVTT